MIYDSFAANASREYELFMFALIGRYLALRTPGVKISPLMISSFRASSEMLRSAYLQSANRTIQGYATEYRSDRSGELAAKWTEELTRVTGENIDQLILRLKGETVSELSGLNMHGGMGLLLQQRLSNPELLVTTASGRKYKANLLVKAEARDFAYRTWLAFELEQIAKTSDLAEVVHPSVNHASNGIVFSISGTTNGYPTFGSLEDTVFHFNANAGVRAYVQT